MKRGKMAVGFIRVQLAFLVISLACVAARGAEISDYKITGGDKLFIDVFGEKDLQREVAVSASGEISFPLLGTVKVDGLTAVQLEAKLKAELGKDYLVDPQVTVTLKDYRKRTVTVMGQVGQPGIVELPAEQKLTVLEAIAMRGGFTRLAKRSGIQVTRPGVARPYRFSEDELKRNNDPEKAFVLRQGDIIMVEESVF
jgi:polysaccharide export outer membrane protein